MDLSGGSCGSSTNCGDWCEGELQSLIWPPVGTRPGDSLHLAWLWVSEAATGVWAGPSGHGHLDLVTFLGNVFHLDSVGFCHPGLSLCLR